MNFICVILLNALFSSSIKIINIDFFLWWKILILWQCNELTGYFMRPCDCNESLDLNCVKLNNNTENCRFPCPILSYMQRLKTFSRRLKKLYANKLILFYFYYHGYNGNAFGY